MNNLPNKKVLVALTLALAIPAFILAPIIWPTAAGSTEPTPIQLMLFMFISAVESVLLGAGLLFLYFGKTLLEKSPMDIRKAAWAFYLGAAWTLISWWPHDNFHRSISESELQKLLYIEYGFHLTLIIAGIAIAWSFFRIFGYIEKIRN